MCTAVSQRIESPAVVTRERAIDGAVLAVAVLGSGALALRLGFDANFDQAQYHVYLGWSLVAGRFEKDIAAAGLGSYFNPLLQVPHYLGLAHLPPRVFSFLLAAVQGLNAFLVYLLSRRVLRGVTHEQPLAALAGLLAACGPCAISLLGTTFGDNVPSILVLCSLLLLCREAEDENARWGRLLFAGLLGGAAAGLKLTCVAFALALGAAAVTVAILRRRLLPLLVFAAGGSAGALLSGGYWGFKLWSRFRNPIFPFANNLFRSPYIQAEQLSDPNWAVRSWTDLVTPPLDLALGRTGVDAGRLQEVAARDVRYAILALLLLAVLGLLGLRRARRAPPAALVVITAWLAAYAVWVRTFHYYRYFAVGEFLAPVALLALLRFLPLRRLAAAWLVIASLVLLTSETQSWGRIGWSDQPLRFKIPLPAGAAPAVVVVAGPETSYALPSFPEQTRFLGIVAATPLLLRDVSRAVAAHTGPCYVLLRQGGTLPPLEPFGLVPPETCALFKTGGRGRLQLCPVARASGPRQ
jgi:hypothetical protein